MHLRLDNAAPSRYVWGARCNGLIPRNSETHLRLQTGRAVMWRWLLFLSAMDVALIMGAVLIGGRIHFMVYVAYPALALFAVVFTSLWLSLSWMTMVAAVYSVVSLTVVLLHIQGRQGIGRSRAM